MKKPIRSAASRGPSRDMLANAKRAVVTKLMTSAAENKAPANSVLKADRLKTQERKLDAESARIKKAGARMAKIQEYSAGKKRK
jgi:hypothetical protein